MWLLMLAGGGNMVVLLAAMLIVNRSWKERERSWLDRETAREAQHRAEGFFQIVVDLTPNAVAVTGF